MPKQRSVRKSTRSSGKAAAAPQYSAATVSAAAAVSEETDDSRDPLYDSEADLSDDSYYECYGPSTYHRDESRHSLQRAASTYTLYQDTVKEAGDKTVFYSEFLKVISETIIPNALVTEDSAAVCESLQTLNCASSFMDAFVYKAVSAALDHSLQKMKWMSGVITILFDSRILSRAAANRGFEKLIQKAEDLAIDVPAAHRLILNFVRCSIDDGVIEEIFLQRIPESFLQNLILTEKQNSTLTGSQEDPEGLKDLSEHLQRLRGYKAAVEKVLINQFMVSGGKEDVQQMMILNSGYPEFKHEIVRRLIKISMGKTNTERELVSSTLSDLFGVGDAQFSPDEILIGFIRVLGEVDDIMIDIPNVSAMLVKFLIRAVVDEILPPVFIIDCIRLRIGGEEGRNITKTVKSWVFEREGLLRIECFRNIWVSVSPDDPKTRKFKKSIKELINEYFAHLLDFDQLYQQLEELEMSLDQQVLFVRKCLEFSMEKGDKERKQVILLLQALVEQWVLHPQTVRLGFTEAWDLIADWSIDIPRVEEFLIDLTAKAKDSLILTDDFSKDKILQKTNEVNSHIE